MIALLQRVTSASVRVDQETVASIDHGLLALIGIEKTDHQPQADKLLEKLLAYRIFEDDAGKMNLSLTDTGGGLLLVSQFTLVADTQKGLRPSFSRSAPPAQSKPLYEYLLDRAKACHQPVASGIFGADMQVTLCNDGPVTFHLQVH